MLLVGPSAGVVGLEEKKKRKKRKKEPRIHFKWQRETPERAFQQRVVSLLLCCKPSQSFVTREQLQSTRDHGTKHQRQQRQQHHHQQPAISLSLKGKKKKKKKKKRKERRAKNPQPALTHASERKEVQALEHPHITTQSPNRHGHARPHQDHHNHNLNVPQLAHRIRRRIHARNIHKLTLRQGRAQYRRHKGRRGGKRRSSSSSSAHRSSS